MEALSFSEESTSLVGGWRCCWRGMFGSGASTGLEMLEILFGGRGVVLEGFGCWVLVGLDEFG